jgi:starch phosphorylase
MAHLATVGSHSIKGVAQLHSELVKSELLSDFYQLFPERFNNKTNGVTPRRWLLYANPKLTQLLRDTLGPDALTGELAGLARLRDYADDQAMLDALWQIKQGNKLALAQLMAELTDVHVNPNSMFVIQVKRIHEYKRQLLACLQIVAHYLKLKHNPALDEVPRTYVFAGKAAAGYVAAKQHIRLINDIASVINRDPDMRGRLNVVFVPNYGVSLAQVIIPAANVSLQISQAGKEASGTSNMKFALNGALTLGTLDGANVEIREAVGPENFFLFGLQVEGVNALRARGYRPGEFIERSPSLKQVLALLETDFFNLGDPRRYHGVVHGLRQYDPYMVCADFDDYVAKEAEAAALYRNPRAWARASLFNIAGSGRFSSDATIRAYAEEIWHVKPVKVEL